MYVCLPYLKVSDPFDTRNTLIFIWPHFFYFVLIWTCVRMTVVTYNLGGGGGGGGSGPLYLPLDPRMVKMYVVILFAFQVNTSLNVTSVIIRPI